MSTQPLDPQSGRQQLDAIIQDAVTQRASDIHLEIFEDGPSIRLRVDGVLRVVSRPSPEDYAAICAAAKDAANFEMGEPPRLQDGRLRPAPDLDIRVSTYPCCYGENITMRLLQKSQISLDLNHVGLTEAQLGTLRRWARSPNGVLLVTGPTGSGKTTVLYSILNELNEPTVKICSIEDPVEYTIGGICQLPINPRSGITFSTALRATLRQDPDIILVGEIRDLQTTELIIQASLTGHLVLSTLHTNSATQAPTRLRDIGVEPFLIKETLLGVTSQRLLRRLCVQCREEYEPDSVTIERLGIPRGAYFRAIGCDQCTGGYRGRLGVFELLELSPACKMLLLKGCSEAELRSQAVSEGMTTMWQAGIVKAREGVTSIEEIVRVIGGPH